MVTVIIEVHAGNRVTVQETSAEGDAAYDNLTVSEEDARRGAEVFLRGLVNNERSADRVRARRDFVDREEEKASLDAEGVAPDRVAANDLPKSDATVASADRNEARSETLDETPQAAGVQETRHDAIKVQTERQEAAAKAASKAQAAEEKASSKAQVSEGEKPGDKATPSASKRAK